MPASPVTSLTLGIAAALLLATASQSAAADDGKAAAVHLRPDKPNQQMLDLIPRQYGDLKRMLALGERCKWMGQAERTAVQASADERLAWLTLWGGKRADADAAAKAAIAIDAQLDCASEQGNSLKGAVAYGAWQMRTTWAMRAHGLLDGPGRPAWFKGLSSVNKQRTALEATLIGLKGRYAESVDPMLPTITKDAERMAAALCPAGNTACPTRAADPEFDTYARAWVKLAEGYAVVLATTKDKVGEPPALSK